MEGWAEAVGRSEVRARAVAPVSGQLDTMHGRGEAQGGVDRCRGAKPFLLVLAVKLLLPIVWKLWAIKYKNDDCVVQWLKTSRATSGRVG